MIELTPLRKQRCVRHGGDTVEEIHDEIGGETAEEEATCQAAS